MVFGKAHSKLEKEMSTRKILKDRRKFLKHLQEKEENNRLSHAISEIDFLLEKLKEFDKITKHKNNGKEEKNRETR